MFNGTIDTKDVFYCSECETHPVHILVSEYFAPEFIKLTHYEDDEENPTFEVTKRKAEILECPTCHSLRFRRINEFEGRQIEDNFPVFKLPTIRNLLPKDRVEIITYDLYNEAINTYNNENYFSSGALVRLIVERLCFEKELEEGNLFNKIKQLNISEDYINALDNIRDLGNKTVHHFYKPKRKELKMAIMVLEYVISEFYFPGFERFQILKRNFDEFSNRPKRSRQ